MGSARSSKVSRALRGISRAALVAVGLFPSFARAQFTLPPNPGLPAGSLPSLIARIVQSALLLVGVIALGFIVYGGFRYIMSRGDEREVETAKNTITYAVIGIIVIGLAYAIVTFVVGALGVGGGGAGGVR